MDSGTFQHTTVGEVQQKKTCTDPGARTLTTDAGSYCFGGSSAASRDRGCDNGIVRVLGTCKPTI